MISCLVVIVSLLYHLDPSDGTADSGGIKFFKNSDGTSSDSKILYDANDNGSQGKSSGLGDLELLTDPAPVEIGNRVWLDSDRDGIQDANEIGIENVSLYWVRVVIALMR